MAVRFALFFLVFFCSGFLALLEAAEGIQAVNLALKDLVYDSFTQKIYGAGTNSLLQIDPDSGEVIASFPLGTNVTGLSLGAEHGIWGAIAGEHAVRRFDLQRMEAGEKIEFAQPNAFFDISASSIDPQTLVFSTENYRDSIQTFGGAVYAVREGFILPNFYSSGDFLELDGTTLYMGKLGYVYRVGISPGGISTDGYRRGCCGLQFEVMPPYVYTSSGSVLAADTLALIDSLPIGSPRRSVLAKNETEDLIYFFYSDGSGAGQLRRYEHPSLQLTGYVELPGIEPEAPPVPYRVLPSGEVDSSTHIISWGTNHLAFNALGKLYLLDPEKLFSETSDLEISQSVPQTAQFATPVSFEVTIHNKGPGPASGVRAVTENSSGLVSISNVDVRLDSARAIPVDFDVIKSGSSVTFSVSVLPTAEGSISNVVRVTSANEANSSDNSNVTITRAIAGPRAPLTLLNFTPRALAYSQRDQRLYYLESGLPWDLFGGNGGSFSLIWSLDPELSRLEGGADTAFVTYNPAAFGASADGLLYTAANSNLILIRPETLKAEPGIQIGVSLYDMALSPADANLVFISDNLGSRLYKGTHPLPNGFAYQARADFSSDGSKLYAVNQETCALQTFAVNENGLSLLQSFGNIGCSDFTAAEGLIYLNSGAIVDASTGEKLATSLVLSPPSIVLPRTNNVLDVITRSSGIWSARRLAGPGHEEIRRVTLDAINGSPVQAVAAGADRLAFRTSGTGLYLVDFDPNLLAGRISLGSDETVAVTFDTVPGDHYRLERLNSVGGAWSTLGGSFVAESSTYVQSVSVAQAQTSFFRLVREQ